MARSLTNNANWAFAKEASLGVLPGSPEWFNLEPNSISSYGANITTVSRDPISKNRQLRKGSTTDLDSSVGLDADLTLSHFENFVEGFCFATSTATVLVCDEVVATGYSVTSGNGDLAQNTLVFARGFDTAANNGLKVVGAASTTTEIKVSGLSAETPSGNATVEIAGVRGTASDLDIDASGDLTSTTLDFTTLGLTVGQFVKFAGFSNSVNNEFARITAIAANKLTLDKKSTTFVAEAPAGAVDIYFGGFVRNVPTDDASFLVQSYQFEAAYKDLNAVGVDEYEYAKGNLANELAFSLPVADKASMTFGFIGTDAEPPSTTRATNAASAKDPNKTEMFNTSADIVRLRITEVDETGLTTDFKDISVTLRNNVSPEKVLGTLGAKYMNYGNFEVMIEGEMLFTDSAVADAIRNNREVTMDFCITNGDGGFMLDIPAMTMGGGERSFPVNESITLSTTAMAHEDEELGTSLGVSLFPYLP